MPYVHPEYKYAYLATPRTASRSTAQVLQENGFVKDGSHHKGLTVFHDEMRSVATAIRDPFDILASWVRRNSKPSLSPEEVVEQEVKTNELITCGDLASLHLDQAIKRLRYENGIQNELNRWLDDVGIVIDKMPTVGQTKRPPLTKGQREMIERYTEPERKRLGYV